MKKKVGRPKKEEQILKEINLSSYRQDIKMFKDGLEDALNDETTTGKETIRKFLALPVDVLNVFIVYVTKASTIKQLAVLLNCDKSVISRIIRRTKNELKEQ